MKNFDLAFLAMCAIAASLAVVLYFTQVENEEIRAQNADLQNRLATAQRVGGVWKKQTSKP